MFHPKEMKLKKLEEYKGKKLELWEIIKIKTFLQAQLNNKQVDLN